MNGLVHVAHFRWIFGLSEEDDELDEDYEDDFDEGWEEDLDDEDSE